MQLVKKQISEIKLAEFNPDSRTAAKSIKPLVKSIEKYGLIYPIAIYPDGSLFDGHRRLAACKQLGWETIPVIIVRTDARRDELYQTVNTNTRRMNGNEQLYVWLRNPNAVSEQTARICQQCQEAVGRDVMVKMARSGCSFTMFRWAKEIQNYVGNSRPSFIKKTMLWLLKHRNTKVVHSLISLKQPAEVILRAINEDKPIAPKYQVT